MGKGRGGNMDVEGPATRGGIRWHQAADGERRGIRGPHMCTPMFVPAWRKRGRG